MAPFPITEARLVALCLESLVLGVLAVTTAICIYAHFDARKRLSSGVTTIAIVLFAIPALDVAFCLYQVLEAFIFYDGPGGALTYLEKISSWVNVMRVRSPFIV